MDKDELLVYLQTICETCINHDVCHGTECGLKKGIRNILKYDNRNGTN